MSRHNVIVGLFFGLTGVVADAAPLIFRFNPPDSITFSVEVKTERTRWFDSTKYPTDSSISTVRRTLKRSGGGYTMVAQAKSIVTKSDGKIADNPINGILMGTKVSSRLDSLGQITSVTGYEKVPSQIDSLFIGQLAARLKESLKPENLAAREQLEWNGKFQGLPGRVIDFGEITYEQAQYPLTGGLHIPFMVAIRVIDTVILNGKLCAVMLISAGSDPNEMTERLKVDSDEIAMHFPLHDGAGMAVTKAGSRYWAESRIVLEIATLLPQSESSRREITVAGEPGAGPRKMRLIESETRHYDYNR
jgi:hypothetical protein